jgi:hypothetical protein
LLVALVLGLALLPGLVRAQATPEPAAPPAFLLEPVGQAGTFFTVTGEAGSVTTLTVALGNAGEAPVTARTYAADAYTLVNGGFGINPEDAPTNPPTTWLDYPAETLDLDPATRVERDFTVTIPDDTAPGQYITGIVLQTAEPIAIGDTGMLKQTIAKALAVFITVPGPVEPNLEIGAVSLDQTANSNALVVEIANTGNVLLKPTGTVTMTRGDEQILTAPVAMGSVYAGMSTTLELAIPTILAPGDYTVDVTLKDEETGAAVESLNVQLNVVAYDAAATPAASPVSIGAFTLEPVTDSTSGNLQVVNITVQLVNDGAPVPSARLTLHVTRDGELVEDFPLNSSLVIPTGTTDIQARYLPITGWEPGTYTFSVTLEAIDPTTGQATVLATADASSTITVP